MATVSSLFIYPDADGPGQELVSSEVLRTGLDGDRPKKAPVSLVSVEDYVESHPRSNVVLTVSPQDLAAMVGHALRIGSVELHITGCPSACPGVYAAVRIPGTMSTGDAVTVSEAPVSDTPVS